MFRRTAVLLLIVPLTAAFAPAPKPKDPKAAEKEERKKLQGTWAIVSITYSGRPTTLVYEKLVIKDDAWSYQGRGREYPKMTLSLDPKAKPKAFDLSYELRDPRAGVAYQGIYQLEGDTLKVSYVIGKGVERPKDFTGVALREYVITFRREKS